jgi:hypothetical protein
VVPDFDDLAFINADGTYTVTLDQNVTIQRYSVGAAVGTQTLLVDTFTMDATQGVPTTVVSGGVMQFANGGTVTGLSPLNNLATIDMGGGTINMTFSNNSLLNISGGTNNITSGAFSVGTSSIIAIGTSATLTVDNGFTNNNVITLSQGGGTLNVTGGPLVNPPGSTITISGAAPARTLGAELDNQENLTLSADLVLNFNSGAHTNIADISLVGGNLTISGAGQTFSNDGNMIINSGRTLTVTAGSLTNESGATMSGEGTLDVFGASFSNLGLVSPGLSAGTLTVTGDYTQTSTGTLDIEIGGTTPGTEHDVINISGAASLDGELNVILTGGFFPTLGDEFHIMTYGSHTGAFSDTTSLNIGSGLQLLQHYDAGELWLETFQPPDFVQPLDPGICITPGDPCLTIPFRFIRATSGIPVRAYSVTFTVSPEMDLCSGVSSIVEGPYLELEWNAVQRRCHRHRCRRGRDNYRRRGHDPPVRQLAVIR